MAETLRFLTSRIGMVHTAKSKAMLMLANDNQYASASKQCPGTLKSHSFRIGVHANIPPKTPNVAEASNRNKMAKHTRRVRGKAFASNTRK